MHLLDRHTIGTSANPANPPRRRRRALSRGEGGPARGSALRLRRRAKAFALISLAILAALAIVAGR